jgi:hypothetical protein
MRLAQMGEGFDHGIPRVESLAEKIQIVFLDPGKGKPLFWPPAAKRECLLP